MAPGTIWDDKAHADLLLALLPVIKPTKDEWDQVLAVVHGKGYTYTSSAVMQHLQKLQKKEAKASADNGEGGSASAASTPAKKTPKKAATPKKRKTPVKKVKSEDDEDDELNEAPAAKKPRTPTRPKIQMDPDVDEFIDYQGAGNEFVPKEKAEA